MPAALGRTGGWFTLGAGSGSVWVPRLRPEMAVGCDSSRASSSVSSWSSAKLAGQPYAELSHPASCFPATPAQADVGWHMGRERGSPWPAWWTSPDTESPPLRCRQPIADPPPRSTGYYCSEALPEKLVSGTWLSATHCRPPLSILPPQTSSEVLTTVWLPEQFHLEPNLLPASLHPRNYSPSPAAPPRSPQTQSRRRLSKITTLRNRLQPHSPSDLDMSTHKRGLENKTSSNARQGENTEIGVAGVTRVQLVFHKTWHVVENCSLLTSGKWQWFSWTPCTLQEVRVSTTVGWYFKRWLYQFCL